jgi:hypothetical protein
VVAHAVAGRCAHRAGLAGGSELSLDRTGAMGPSFVHCTEDGQTVVYEVVRSLTDLFVVDGLR